MADFKEIVDNIRVFLTSEEQIHTDEVAHWAAEYCAALQGRERPPAPLADCMQQGLRDEAVQMADAPPNLLDLVVRSTSPS